MWSGKEQDNVPISLRSGRTLLHEGKIVARGEPDLQLERIGPRVDNVIAPRRALRVDRARPRGEPDMPRS